MNQPLDADLRRFCEPTFAAAVITWIAVFAMTLVNDGRSWPFLDADATRALALASCLAFLALMLISLLVNRNLASISELTLFALEAVLALIISAAAEGSAGPILLIIVMSQFAGVLGVRALTTVFVLINAVLFLVHWHFWGLGNAAIGGLSYGGFQLFAIMATRSALMAERSSLALKEVNAHLLATRSLLAESARDQERLRIARELHDVAGHKLTALKLQLTALARRRELGEDEAVRVSAQLADELLGDIRHVVKQMREHEGMNLAAAIAELAAPFPRPKVHVDIAEDARVDSVAKADAIVRAVQEALTNAARHAHAENLWISLRRAGERVAIDIHDDGLGTKTTAVGSGLAGMRERFQEVGGEVAWHNGGERGFRIQAWVPMT